MSQANNAILRRDFQAALIMALVALKNTPTGAFRTMRELDYEAVQPLFEEGSIRLTEAHKDGPSLTRKGIEFFADVFTTMVQSEIED